MVYPFVLVTNRRALFWATCNWYFGRRVRELRETDRCMRAGRLVFLYSLSFICWFRPKSD